MKQNYIMKRLISEEMKIDFQLRTNEGREACGISRETGTKER